MRRILFLTCSPRGADAHSARFAEEVLGELRARHPGLEVARRDLASDPPPIVDAGFSAAILANDAAAPALAASEALIGALEAADALVIATPMHNFGVPAVLKAWVDQIVRIHRTFRSTPEGKVGVLPDRPVVVVVASGGWFTGPSPIGTPAQPDFLTPYLRAILATVGLRDLRLVTLEGMARGPDSVATALAKARDALPSVLEGI